VDPGVIGRQVLLFASPTGMHDLKNTTCEFAFHSCLYLDVTGEPLDINAWLSRALATGLKSCTLGSITSLEKRKSQTLHMPLVL
jgi:hypothetical protein